MSVTPANAGNPRDRLRLLRNHLALEAPRARVRTQAPPELVARLQSALHVISSVYLAGGREEEAAAEGERVLSEWELWLAEEKRQPKPLRLAPANQRQHERFETNLPVRLVRHGALNDARGDTALASAGMVRQARNVSLGGIFVSLREDELPEIVAGSVVHLLVPGQASAVGMRATVARRDAGGLGLRWLVDSPRTQRSIDAILDAVQKPR